MGRAYIGLGSNLGDGRHNLLEAWRRLGEQAGLNLLALSSPYLTRPMFKPEWLAAGQRLGEALFTNAVGVLESRLTPPELLATLLGIEETMGRDRAHSVDRPVDLDLLYYDDQVLVGADLQLPHPGIQTRRFVLAPLAELSPDFRHPLLGLSSIQMLQQLGQDDIGEILRLDWPEGHYASDWAGTTDR